MLDAVNLLPASLQGLTVFGEQSGIFDFNAVFFGNAKNRKFGT